MYIFGEIVVYLMMKVEMRRGLFSTLGCVPSKEAIPRMVRKLALLVSVEE